MKSDRTPHAWLVAALLAFPALANASTVAYWRFEEATSGAVAAGAGGEAIYDNSVLDSSGNGNHIRTYATWSAPTYVTTVPFATVAQTGATNSATLSLDGGDDLYSGAAVAPTLNSVDFNQFTIEAWVNLNDIAGWQTFIGRDDSGNPGEAAGPESLLYFQKMGDGTNRIRVRTFDSTGTGVAVHSTFAMTAATWYHVAAVSNGSSLALYIDGALQESTPMTGGLFDPAANTIWTLGRGQYNGSPGDQMRGRLDEVRISDSALTTSQFLNAVPEPGAAILGLLGVIALLRRRR